MHRREPLLPLVTSNTDYEAMRPDANLWLLVMQAICQRHGLPTEKLVRFGNGTDTAFGSNIVFAVDEHHVIKLYPPYSHAMRNEMALGVNRLLDHGRSSTSTSSERSWRACVMGWTSLGGVLLAIRMAPSDQKRVCAV